ncbi:MAG: hypothetical protein AAFR47_07915 [Pseudomonadota bacterium]
MPEPFIVWAFQRTGGTTLFNLLGRFFGHGPSYFEPFNPANAAGYITKTFKETKDEGRLRADMEGFLAQGRPIKNCYELHPLPLQHCCFEVSREMGFRHAILDRRDDVSRVFSRELALLTGAWGKTQADEIYPDFLSGKREMPPMDIARLRSNLRRGMRRRQWLIDRMNEAGISPYIILFENVYGAPGGGEAEVDRVFDFLGLPRDDPDYADAVAQALHTKSQNTTSVRSLVPNLDEARAVLDKAGAGRNPWARIADQRTAAAAG